MRWVSTSVSVRILEDRHKKKITSQWVFKVSNRFLFELKGLYMDSVCFAGSFLPELWVLSCDDAHLQLRRLEVDGENSRQAGDCRLKEQGRREKGSVSTASFISDDNHHKVKQSLQVLIQSMQLISPFWPITSSGTAIYFLITVWNK